MPKWLNLRVRFALFFAALALGGAAIFGAAIWFGYSRTGGPIEGYITGWLMGSFGLVGLAAWIGLLFDENVAKPIRALAADLLTRAKSDVSVELDQTPARYLGSLAPAAQSIYAALEEARTSQARALADRTKRLRRDKALLEALIRDLAEGVVVIAPDGAILLYNQVAVEILGPLGIDRPLGRFIGLDPVTEATKRLDQDATKPTESFLTATPNGNVMLTGAVSNVGVGDDLVGHVLIFHDATEDLRTHGDLDGVLSSLMDGARRPAMTIGAMLDVLDQDTPLPQSDVTKLTGTMRDEVGRLTDVLNRAEKSQAAVADSLWPMRDILAKNIFDALRVAHGDDFAVEAPEVRLHCDGFAITKLWEKAMHALKLDPTRTGFRFGLEIEDRYAHMVLTWQGPSLRQTTLDAVTVDPLSSAYGPYQGRDALKAHRTDIWIEPGPRLVLPLPIAEAAHPSDRPDRPDFYDFNRPLDGCPGKLKDLAYVVFDTETTGLDAERDDVVQLAGVRVLRDRCVRGEIFDSLVMPERPIPVSASEIHGVTNEMVKGAPRFRDACADFADFAEGAVLVAHHAAFDMAFLKRMEEAGGPKFDNPVLCTALLSSKLNRHANDHTLDALADRYGVTLEESVRHTALGDAQATAEVFLKMLPVLADKDVTSLQDALEFQSS